MVKRIKEKILHILHMDDDPKDIALAFSIGVFIAFFPIFGIHTLMAFGGAWLLGVSPVVALAGTFVNNPWTIPLIYGGGLYLGLVLTGQSLSEVNIDFADFKWSDLSWEMMANLAETIGFPFVVGCIVLGVVAAIITYPVMLKVVIAYRARSSAPG